jgi:predicted nucleic acid-binding protein
MRFVIGADVALRLAREAATVPDAHRLVAPTLLRSQVLAMLYAQERRGELTKKEADRRLDHLRGLRIRLLGDRVSQAHAWRIAAELGRDDTFDAEYLAVTRLQADAFVTLDAGLAREVGDLVPLAPYEALLEAP